jgi:hypothetical protein
MVDCIGTSELPSSDYDINQIIFVTSLEGYLLGENGFLLKTFGVPPHSGYGSTEAGAIIYQYAGFKNWVVKPGSLGKPMPGIDIALLDKEGNVIESSKLSNLMAGHLNPEEAYDIKKAVQKLYDSTDKEATAALNENVAAFNNSIKKDIGKLAPEFEKTLSQYDEFAKALSGLEEGFTAIPGKSPLPTESNLRKL